MKRAIFMGRRPHSIQALEHLLASGWEIPLVVAPSGTGREVPYWSPRLRDVALSLGLKVVADTDIYQALRDDWAGPVTPAELRGIDLVVSFLFWKRIKRQLIDLPRLGCLNFHPAPLPDYRGLGGYNFAILDELSHWGATVHNVDEAFDTGSIIEVARFAFDHSTHTALSLERATRPVIVDLFRRTIDRLAADRRLPGTPQGGGRYINRAEFEAAKRVDPSWTANRIETLARAFWYPPFEGAYLEIDGRRFTLAPAVALRALTELHQEGPRGA